MARCKLCGKSGWFYSISADGLCKECEKAAKASADRPSPDTSEREISYRGQLKPATLSDYVGQDAIKRDLQSKIAVAKQNRSMLPHILLCGPSEMGKATLARAIAGEMEENIRQIHADMIEGTKGLQAILASVEEGGFCLIEEIESLPAPLLRGVISAVEDFTIDLIIGQGPSALRYPLKLSKFTLIGTT